MEPDEVIRKEYKGSANMMTPNIVEYGWIIENEMAYEISSGNGIYAEKIYGVSVVSINKKGRTSRERKLSSMFHSMSAVRDHISTLKGVDQDE
jgi:hypothetical protein